MDERIDKPAARKEGPFSMKNTDQNKIFYASKHFTPRYGDLFEMEEEGLYRRLSDGSLFVKRELYNWGYGNEQGYVKLPLPGFEELLERVIGYRERIGLFRKDRDGLENLVGAVSLLMADHRYELVDWLEVNIRGPLFEDKDVLRNFHWFCFLTGRDKPPFYGGIGVRSYESVLNQIPKWHEIRDEVVEVLYGFLPEPLPPYPGAEEEDEEDEEPFPLLEDIPAGSLRDPVLEEEAGDSGEEPEGEQAAVAGEEEADDEPEPEAEEEADKADEVEEAEEGQAPQGPTEAELERLVFALVEQEPREDADPAQEGPPPSLEELLAGLDSFLEEESPREARTPRKKGR